MALRRIKESHRLQTKANFNKLWIHHQNAICIHTHTHTVSQFCDLLQFLATFCIFHKTTKSLFNCNLQQSLLNHISKLFFMFFINKEV